MGNKLFQWVKGSKTPKGSNKSSKDTQETIQLVEGVFSPAEAADVLLTLINDKIKFHTIHALHLKGDYEDDTLNSEKRIEQLREAKKLVYQIVVNARDKGHKLKIDSTITIQKISTTD